MAETRLSEAEIEALDRKHCRLAPFGVNPLAYYTSDEEIWLCDTARLLADRSWLLDPLTQLTQKYGNRKVSE